MSIQLTKVDEAALRDGDSVYLNGRGADAYYKADYETALEYYRLAAAMGNVESVSNLGYCYMYGRGVEKNMGLAVAYFRLAAERGNPDALYKLGSIYRRGADGVEADGQLGVYYYQRALDVIAGQPGADGTLYPSLMLALAKEHLPDGLLEVDLNLAWQFLELARQGYESEIAGGAEFYKGALSEVKRMQQLPIFLQNLAEEDEMPLPGAGAPRPS